MKINERIKKLITAIQKGVVGKETIFNLCMLTMLSGESVFLLGRPGIAKSLIARRFKYSLKDGHNFEHLMNPFTTPEEIVGPISIKSLQEGVYERLPEGYLPTANVAFLDEIWKAGPSIQNYLLTMVNEKIFSNAGKDMKVPLVLLIAASNELPAEGEGLEALYDRFVMRYIGVGLKNKKDFDQMLTLNTSLQVEVDDALAIKLDEYYEWRKEVIKVTVPQLILDFIGKFRDRLDEITKGTAYISDRRWNKIVNIMRTSAYFNGRTEIDKCDLLVIPYCIWDDEEQEQEYTKVFFQFLDESITFEFDENKNKLMLEMEEIQNTLATFKSEDMVKNVYRNIFGGSLKGRFYRIVVPEQDYPICFIRISDYERLRKNVQASVKLYLSNDLAKLGEQIAIVLLYKQDGILVNNKTNFNYNLEIKDSEKVTLLNELTEDIDRISKALQKIDAQIQQEKIRLKAIENIFFTQQWQLKLNQWLGEDEEPAAPEGSESLEGLATPESEPTASAVPLEEQSAESEPVAESKKVPAKVKLKKVKVKVTTKAKEAKPKKA